MTAGRRRRTGQLPEAEAFADEDLQPSHFQQAHAQARQRDPMRQDRTMPVRRQDPLQGWV